MPHCGAKVKKPGIGLGIAAMIFGFLGGVIGIILGIPSIVVGAKNKNTPAIIMGAIGIVLAVIWISFTAIKLL